MSLVQEHAAGIREYRPSDEPSWLRCRVLGFLDSAYFDDVKNQKTSFDNPAIEVVAVDDDEVVGVIDVEVFGELATIDTIAVLPSHRRDGVASRLLDAALERLPGTVVQLDAWTREDEAANRWYRAKGFDVRHQYLHVYAEGAPFQRTDDLDPVIVFAHSRGMEDEERLRAEHERVHICQRYVRDLSGNR
jgi:ribosomal protein S18 acetylase RimI-like enzyme